MANCTIGAFVLIATLMAAVDVYADESERLDADRRELKGLIIDFYKELAKRNNSANAMYESLSNMSQEEADNFIENIQDPSGLAQSIRAYLSRSETSDRFIDQKSRSIDPGAGLLAFGGIGFDPDRAGSPAWRSHRRARPQW